MKRRILKINGIIAVAICVALSWMLFANLTVSAADIIATVSGTIEEGTTADLIKLNADGVHMLIKVDSATDSSTCKFLLPGYRISVSVYRGSDAYLHAAKINLSSEINGLTYDMNSKKTVTGEIKSGSNQNRLVINSGNSDINIKYNAGTDFSGCRSCTIGAKVSVIYVKANDGKFYALTVADYLQQKETVSPAPATPLPTSPSPETSVINSNPAKPTTVTITDNYTGKTNTVTSTTNTSTTNSPTTNTATTTTATTNNASVVTAGAVTVQGIVQEKTDDKYIYITSKEGDMTIKLDDTVDTTNCRAWVVGLPITAEVYRGSDAYMHATKITGTKENYSPVAVDAANSYKVVGSVTSDSTESILYLKTSSTVMQIRLDPTTSYNGIKGFYDGENVKVVCARGDDAYMHAISITKK